MWYKACFCHVSAPVSALDWWGPHRPKQRSLSVVKILWKFIDQEWVPASISQAHLCGLDRFISEDYSARCCHDNTIMSRCHAGRCQQMCCLPVGDSGSVRDIGDVDFVDWWNRQEVWYWKKKNQEERGTNMYISLKNTQLLQSTQPRIRTGSIVLLQSRYRSEKLCVHVDLHVRLSARQSVSPDRSCYTKSGFNGQIQYKAVPWWPEFSSIKDAGLEQRPLSMPSMTCCLED